MSKKVKIQVGAEDVEKAADQGDFEQAPVGMYVAELVEVNPGFAKGENDKPDKSRPYLECIWSIVGLGREGADLDGKRYSRIWDYVSFSEESKWKMAQFALTLGLKTDAKGNISHEIEIEPNTPGTVIGTKAIIRVKKDSDLDGNYRAKIGGTYNIEGQAEAESGNAAFSEDEPEDANDSPFGDDDASGDDDLLTEEGLAEMDLKELGSIAGEFDLTPQDFIVKTKGKTDPDKTKAAIIAAILEAQDGPADDQGDDEVDTPGDDPF